MSTLDQALLQVLISVMAAQQGISEAETYRRLAVLCDARPAGDAKPKASTVSLWGME